MVILRQALRFRLGAASSVVLLLLAVAAVRPLTAQTFSPIPPLSFTKVFNGANPLPQLITVTSTGAALAFDAAATTTTGGAWLTLTSCGSWCTTPEALAVTVNPATTLAAGTYAGQIVISVHGNSSNSMTVPVSLTIAATGAAFFDDLPGQLTFSAVTGSSTAPPSQPVQVRNGGSGTLTWTASSSTADGGGWLTVSQSSGAAPSTVSIGVVTGSLPGGGFTAGTYIGQVTFSGAGGNVTIPVSFVIGTNILEQANPISFTKPFGGANPLPQILTIASTGTAIAFDGVASTANGGAWLTITSCGSWCTTPEAITVTPNPAVTLAAGTYTAQVTFTVHSTRTQAITVPVTLTVGASSGQFFDNVPGQLTYSLISGASGPPAQSVQLRNGGTGTLSWTSAASTADGSEWLTVSAPSGNAPATVTIAIVPTLLPGGGILAGTYTGQVAFVTAGNSVTIPVSVVVGDSVFEQLNPIAFTKPLNGSNPLPQTLSVASTGAALAFDAVTNTANGGAWLTITSCGSWCTTPEAITVTANPAVTLAAGTYTAQVTFTVHGTRTMALTVPVTLTVVASTKPFFDSLPGQLSFSLVTGGNPPPGQLIQVRNGGTGTLTWSAQASTSDGGPWLSTSVTSGTAPTNVTVKITVSSLPNGGIVAGTFAGTLLFHSANSTVTIPVTVTVGASVFEQVNPINFSKPLNGSNPFPQVLNVASTGAALAFDAVAATANGGSWLTITSCGSWCTTPEAITVTANPAVTLAAGTYSGEILFTVHGSRIVSMTVPVTLTIAATTGTFFDSLAGQLSFSMLTAGNAPPCQSVQVRNAGSGTLTFSAKASTADGGAWLTVSPASGSAPATINVCVTPTALPGGALLAGTFTGEILLQSASGVGTIPIVMAVGSSVFEQVNPISFTKAAGGANPLPQVLTIASTGAAIAFDAVASTANGGAWLQITSCGSWCTTPEAITVTPNPAVTLAAGIYSGEVIITTHGSGNLSMAVPVTLTIAATTNPFFDNVPGAISYSFQTAGGTPPSQTLQIRNGGAGTLTWSAAVSTSDGAAWLKLSAKTGTAPASLTVAIVPASLPGQGLVAGTFTGQLAFTASGSRVTIPVSVTVGDSVFRQVNALNFVKPSGGANPLPQYFTVASTDPAVAVAFDAVAISGNGGTWLQIPSCGSWCTTPDVITVTANPAVTLAAGTYTAEIILSVHGSGNMSMIVPVTLTVAATSSAFFDNIPGEVTFSMLPGGATPAAQGIQLRNGGSGTLTWTAATSTADGAAWLKLTPKTGTATSSVSVSITPASLPGQGLIAGTFIGQLTFVAPTGNVTVPVTVNVGTAVFVQASPVSFSKPFGGSNPTPQQITGASTGANIAFDDIVATGNGGSWLTISSCGSWCTTSQAVTATVNAASTLAVGTYTGQVTFVVHGSRTMSMMVPVTLTVH